MNLTLPSQHIFFPKQQKISSKKKKKMKLTKQIANRLVFFFFFQHKKYETIFRRWGAMKNTSLPLEEKEAEDKVREMSLEILRVEAMIRR